MIELVVAAWFCFQGADICYDQNAVQVKSPEIATVIMDGKAMAMLGVNCEKKATIVVMQDGTSLVRGFGDNSPASFLCEKYLPGM